MEFDSSSNIRILSKNVRKLRFFSRRKAEFLIRTSLVLFSIVFSLVIIELLLRTIFTNSTFGAGSELVWFRSNEDMSNLLIADDSLGFRPILNNSVYDAFGILRNNRTELTTNINKAKNSVLLIGDSVTARGRIERALREKLKDKKIQFLNGGVESYNVEQEVEFFFRYQSINKFSRIIHQLHVNDIQPTPIAFRSTDGALNVYALNMHRMRVSKFLYQYSYLYRLGLAKLLYHGGQDEIADPITRHLERIAYYSKAKNISYDILLFPILSPVKNWSKQERKSWKTLLKSCEKLSLNCISLLPVLESMNAKGISPHETHGDNWHPNDEFSRLSAELIIRRLSLDNSSH